MSRVFANNATSTLDAGISDADTTLSVIPGTGGLFPAIADPDFMDLTLEDVNGNIEIVRCSAHTAGADTMTLSQRGVEGSTPAAFAAGSRVEIRLTAAALNGWLQEGDILAGGTF